MDIASRLSAIVLCVSAILAACGELRADETDYRIRTGEKILSGSVVSPRAMGMAGSYTALRGEGAHGLYQNPAVLGGLGNHQWINNYTFAQVREDDRQTTYNTVTIGGAVRASSLEGQGRHFNDEANHGAGVRYSHIYGSAHGANGADFGSDILTLGYGRAFNYGRVLGGVSLSYHTTHVDDMDWRNVEMNRYELRAGILMRMTRELTVGGVMSFGGGDASNNLGIESGGDGEVYCSEYRIGAGMQMTDRWLLTGDLTLQDLLLKEKDAVFTPTEEHEILRFSVGSEVDVLPRRMTLRGGIFIVSDEWRGTLDADAPVINYESRRETAGGLAFGSTWYHDNWAIDWASEIRTEGDHAHNFSFVYDF